VIFAVNACFRVLFRFETKFRTFDLAVKIRGGWAKYLGQFTDAV